MKHPFKRLALTLLLVVATSVTAKAQHTFGLSMGTGMANGRFEPTQETKPIWGRAIPPKRNDSSYLLFFLVFPNSIQPSNEG